MNKQLTKKTIGIAASAALMASLAVSSSALAGPGGNSNKGPQASADVSTWCEISDEAAGIMTVHISSADKSSGDAFGYAQIGSAKVDLLTKDKGNSWTELDFKTPALMLGVDAEVTFNLCGQDLGKAINAETSIKLDETYFPASKPVYTAQCGDNPATDEIEGGLKTADYPNLCTL